MPDSYIYDMVDEWNAGGTVFNAIKMDVTDTAYAAGSSLLNLLVDSVSKFKVTPEGWADAGAFWTLDAGAAFRDSDVVFDALGYGQPTYTRALAYIYDNDVTDTAYTDTYIGVAGISKSDITAVNGTTANFGGFFAALGTADDAGAYMDLEGGFFIASRKDANDVGGSAYLYGLGGYAGHASTLNSSAVSDFLWGLYFAVEANAGTIGTIYNADLPLTVGTTSGKNVTVTNIRQINLTTPVFGRASGNTVSVTNLYSLYAPTPAVNATATITNRFGLYVQDSAAINFLGGKLGLGETAPDYKLDVNGTIGFTPGTSVTPVDNGDVVFEFTSNTSFKIKGKGSDGTVRSVTLTLA